MFTLRKKILLPVLILLAVGLAGIVFTSVQTDLSWLDATPAGIFLSQTKSTAIFIIATITLLAVAAVLAFCSAKDRSDSVSLLENEKQYREALLTDSLGAFEVNMSKNLVTKIVSDDKVNTMKDFFKTLKLSVPCRYTDFLEACAKNCDPSYIGLFKALSCEKSIQHYAENNKSSQIESWYSLPAGKHIFVKSECLLTKDAKTEDILCLIVNKNRTSKKLEEERKDQEIFNAHFIDPITNGWNRTFFDLQAMRMVKANPPDTYSLVIFDVAGFTIINNMYGLEFGNRLLKHIHKIICQNQLNDEIYCRHANDVFNILIRTRKREELENYFVNVFEQFRDIEGCEKIAEKGDSTPFYVSIKAGVVDISDPTEAMFTIRDKANIAKKSNNVKKLTPHLTIGYYEDFELVQKEKEEKIASKMELALKNGEFEAWLQPKLDLKTKKISGAEALVRWNDKTEGLIPPNDFIPVMERNGFVTQVDYAVFEQVCVFLKKIIDEGFEPIRISSNFSRLHLRNEHFIDSLVEICNKYKVPTKYLELEITETAIFDNFSTVMEATKKAHAAGFLCSIDDFGSGYSSLNMLTELPFDVIKLDKSFFGKLNELTENRQYVIKSMVELGQNLGMHMIIEGVETQEQLHFLCDIGCDNAQGYVLSKPIRMEEFADKYIRNNFQWQD